MVSDESKMAKLKPLYKKAKKTEGGRGGGGYHDHIRLSKIIKN